MDEIRRTIMNEFSDETVIPYRDTLSPKTQTFSGVIEAKFEFG